MNFGEYHNRLFGGHTGNQKDEEEADPKEFGVRLEIDDDVFKKIMYWIDKSEFEVSGLGKIEFDEKTNTARVIDAILLPQKNTSTTTDIDGAAVGKAMFLLKDTPGELKWWWHSHVNMETFWSGTDKNTIMELGSGGWFMATVFNKSRKMLSAYCQAKPIRLLISGVETSILETVDEDLSKEWDSEYDKNVENVHHIYSSPGEHGYGGYPRYTRNDKPWWEKEEHELTTRDRAMLRENEKEAVAIPAEDDRDMPISNDDCVHAKGCKDGDHDELCNLYDYDDEMKTWQQEGFVFGPEIDEETGKLDLGSIRRKQ
jgi:hypothetical protein